MSEMSIDGFQKIRLAWDEGRNGEHLPATRGHFSEGFYKRLCAALSMAPGVVGHVLSMVTVDGGSDDRVDGSRDAPLPMNVQAFSDTNELYSKLVYFTGVFAAKLGRQAPGPARRAWRDMSGKIVGLPYDIRPDQARYQTGIICTWLTLNLEDILGTDNRDDVMYFHDEVGQDIFRINTAWPQKARARYSDMHCPDADCKGRIAVYPPRMFGDDERIVCEGCGRHFLPKDYLRLIGVFQQIRAERRSAENVTAHLMRTYGKRA